MKPAAALAALALVASSASAQPFTPDSTVHFSLTWEEFNGNGNGDLQEGESALIRLSVAFSDQNSIGSFSPPVGTFSSGTIRGFSAGFVDLLGTGSSGNANGSWNLDNAVLPEWDLLGPPGYGTPTGGGSNLTNIQFGQFPPGANSINTTNPIHSIWQGIWTPASYTTRTVTFSLAAAIPSAGHPASVLFRIGSNGIASVFTPFELASVRIPVSVPAPSGLALLALAACARRRR
jgi:hypothetical protein